MLLSGALSQQRSSAKAATCFSTGRYRQKLCCIPRAGNDSNSGWDEKWKEAVKKAKQGGYSDEALQVQSGGVPKTDSQPVQSAPKFAKPSKRGEKVKEQESLLLDVWTQENTFKLGGALVVGLLLVFVFIIGPP